MRIFRFLPVVLLLPALVSCGQLFGKRDAVKSGFTKVTIRTGGDGLHTKATLLGGIMVFAINTAVTRGGATSLVDDADSTSFVLPNDTYKFYAVGWTGGGGPFNMEGQGYCGFGNGGAVVSLGGEAVTVDLVMTQATCGFSSGSFFTDPAGSDGTGTNFDLVTISACSVFTGTTCTTVNTGFAGSVRVVFDAWLYDNGLSNIENVKLVGKCYPFAAGVATTQLTLPVGLYDPGGSSSPNPFQVTTEVFSDSTCTTFYTSHKFDGGLYNGNRSGYSGVTLTGTPNQVYISVP